MSGREGKKRKIDHCMELAQKLNEIANHRYQDNSWRYGLGYTKRYKDDDSYRVYNVPAAMVKGMQTTLRKVSIERFLRYCKSSTKLITIANHALVIQLVIFLVYKKRWDDIITICERVKFREYDCVLHDPKKNYQGPIETGLLAHLIDSNTPVDLLQSIVNKFPREVVKGNSGLHTLFRILDEREQPYYSYPKNYPRTLISEKMKTISSLYHTVLASNPSAVYEEYRIDRDRNCSYPNCLARILSINLSVNSSGISFGHKSTLTFVARQWRAICEAASRCHLVASQNFIDHVLPFIPNPGTPLLQHSRYSHRGYLRNFLHSIAIGERKDKRDGFNVDVKHLLRLLLDFLPGSVLNHVLPVEDSKGDRTPLVTFEKINIAHFNGSENIVPNDLLNNL